MPRKRKIMLDNQIKYSDQYFDIRGYLKDFPNALYYVVASSRSDGKSHSCLRLTIEHFFKTGEWSAYIRRLDNQIFATAMKESFKSLECDDFGRNTIEEITNGKYNSVKAHSGYVWLINNTDPENVIQDPKPFLKCFCLNKAESYKSRNFPQMKYIIFEEFIATDYNIINEFVKFKSLISTIVRNKKYTKIIMLGNTNNPLNIYYDEMYLTDAESQPIGSIKVYKNITEEGDTLEIVSIRPAPLNRKIKKSNIYFAFGGQTDDIITKGKWELEDVPHLSHIYTPKDIKLTFYIEYRHKVFEGHIISLIDSIDNIIYDDIILDSDKPRRKPSNKRILFVYIHPKTSYNKYKYNDIIFTDNKLKYNYLPNVYNKISERKDNVGLLLLELYRTNKFEYYSNMIGLVIKDFI